MWTFEITWRTDNNPVEGGPTRELIQAQKYRVNRGSNDAYCMDSIEFLVNDEPVREIFSRPASINRLGRTNA